MTETHFGLTRRPFRAGPDHEAYYPATGHEQALAQLLHAVGDGEGLAVLTGQPGTGKTLLCYCLLERLGQDVTVAFLTNSHVAGRAGLLQAILYDLAQPYEPRGEQELRLALTDFLLQNYSAGRRTVLVLDEAHHLTPDLLEELRLLGNLEGRKGKALQVVLAALPEIEERLSSHELSAFRQRLAVRTRLEPLDLHEAADYLVHHLRRAGAQPERVMTDEALEVLARAGQGVPRLLNRAAHQALALAVAAEADIVDAEVALEAVAMVGLGGGEEAANDLTGAEAEPDRPGRGQAEELTDAGKEAGRLRRLFAASSRRPA